MKLKEKKSPSGEATQTASAAKKAAGVQAMGKQLVLKPRMSEKTYGLSLTSNVYVFNVPENATKQSVAAAVTAQFGVSVTNVNMASIKGKVKRTFRKGSRPVIGQRSDIKKAFVTLKDGDTLPFFETEDDKKKKSDKKAEKTEKKDKGGTK